MREINDRVEPLRWPIAPHVKNLEASAIREILKFTSQPDVISFAGGLPAPELFPLKKLGKVAGIVLEKYGPASVQYSLSQGIIELRRLLAERATARGVPTDPENILITTGSQQGIELLARSFIDPGDYIITENPTYVGALQAFNYYQTRYATIPMDEEGMMVDLLEDKIKQYNPKLIYTVSNFQNPTGITMSARRRIRLVELASRYDIPVVDDNPYSDIRFAGEPLPTLKAHGGDEVIALKTFSKTITPGLRIGWINGPKTIIDYFEKVKQCIDLHTSTFNQYLISEFIAQGYLDAHIEEIKADYLAKRNLMLKTMDETFPEGISWTRPEGGLFLWVELPKGMNARRLFDKAVAMRVAYVPGQAFYPHGEGANTLRLNFSNATHEGIEEGIRRLARLFSENL
jgi:2-aminoadipate transaminase